VTCPPAVGACCLFDGSCVQVSEADCAAMSGTYSGDLSMCIDVTCPQPPGACCLTDGTCVEVTEEDCTALGGMFQGDFSTCGGASCPQPPGACCLTNDTCVEVTEEDCTAQGGIYRGDFTSCADISCEGSFIVCYTLDFSFDDVGNAMPHGAKVDTEFDGGPNYPVTITSSVNISGASTGAILDSTNGPAFQDPDLLVGKGNILILQTDADLTECPPASGIYCTHNDDENGGRLSFAFNVPVSPSDLVLIDIDASDPTSTVVLTDSNGKTRTYTVPGNWTGDKVTDGPPGYRTLSLTTLANQPGFGSTATASEQAGFDPDAVIRIDVNLGGSGGVDDLTWCQ
jgi:hypothetical protein